MPIVERPVPSEAAGGSVVTWMPEEEQGGIREEIPEADNTF